MLKSFFLLFFVVCLFSVSEGQPLSSEEEMILIPAGEFLMGSRGDEGILGVDIGVDELPQRKINIAAFYIDKFEVTVGDYKKFSKATGHPLPGLLTVREKKWRADVNYPPIKDSFPVNDVNSIDAEVFCKWAGKRLPTEAEWEKAARGADGRSWPWGNKADIGMSNTIEWSADKVAAVSVGSFPKDVSPYGVYDMAGNIMEWTSSWYDAYPGSKLKRDRFGKKFKVMKGGSWMSPILPFSRAAYRFSAGIREKNHHPHFGFRCARDRE